MNLNTLRDQAYKTACDHGFHDKELSNEHLLMLVITELAEAVEADQKGKVAQRRMFEMNCDTPHEDPKHHWCFCFEHFIKDSVQDELADAVIRLLDFAGLRGFDIDIDDISVSMACESCEGETFTESIYVISQLCCDHVEELLVKDIICNVLGLAKHLDIDLLWHIEQKMKYNQLRPAMHGKKY